MATLTGLKIKDTYQGLLKTDNNSGVTSNYTSITDGTGNTLPILISTTGTKFTNNIILSGQSKIAFDDDPTNTYIQGGVDDPESIIFNADNSFQFFTDNDFMIYGGLSSPFALFEATWTGSSTPLLSVGGTVRNSGYTFDVQGTLFSDKTLLKTDFTTSAQVNGHLIKLGSSTTIAGDIYVLSGSSWVAATEDNCTGLMGIAVGTNSGTDGMLVFGTTSHEGGTYTAGAKLYCGSTAGSMTTTAPTASGKIVRIVGYALGGIQIYFNPSSEYITLA